ESGRGAAGDPAFGGCGVRGLSGRRRLRQAADQGPAAARRQACAAPAHRGAVPERRSGTGAAGPPGRRLRTLVLTGWRPDAGPASRSPQVSVKANHVDAAARPARASAFAADSCLAVGAIDHRSLQECRTAVVKSAALRGGR
ncbi:hypothetical protein QU38_01305, partial [Staphylococcus aureus]